MTTSRLEEYRIIRRILRQPSRRKPGATAEGLIVILAFLAALGVLASFVPGLLWLLLVGALVLTLGG